MPLNLGQSSCLSLPLPPLKAGIPGLSHHSQPTNSWLLLTHTRSWMGVQGSVSTATRFPLAVGRLGAWPVSPRPSLRAHVAPSSRSSCSATATLVESLTRRPTDLRAEWLRVSGPSRLRPCPPGSSLGGSLPPELCSAGSPPLGRQPEGTSGQGDGRKRAEAGERETEVGEGAPSGPRASGEPEIADAPL